MVCPNCGHENEKKARYCVYCGKTLDGRGDRDGSDPIIYMAAITAILAVLFVIMLVYTLVGGRKKSITSSEDGSGGAGQEESLLTDTNAEQEPAAGTSGVNEDGDVETAEKDTEAAQAEKDEAELKVAQGEDYAAAISGQGIDGRDSQEKAVSPEDVPEKYFYHNGHTYAFYDSDHYGLTTYTAARDFCKKQGGYLAVINDASENQSLFDFLTNNYTRTAMFGYTDESSEGRWVWSDGSSSYENWTDNEYQQQPNNTTHEGSDEDYAEFNYDLENVPYTPNDGTWNDAPFGYYTTLFICEWDTVIE